MEGVGIRSFAEADHAEVMELWCRAWEATVPGVDLRANWPEMLAQWSDMLARGSKAYVAHQVDDRILGFIVLSNDESELEQIAVAPAFFGTGVADALILSAKARSHSVDGLAAIVNTFNVRAIRFYEKQDFECLGEVIHQASGLPVFRYVWIPPSRTQTPRS